MKNEYGVKLDSSGYAPSIMTIYPSDCCFICDHFGDLARHEIFNGSERSKSKAYGLWVNLCPECHTKVHKNPREYIWLKRTGQREAMNWYEWTTDEFIERFGKNYAEE